MCCYFRGVGYEDWYVGASGWGDADCFADLKVCAFVVEVGVVGADGGVGESGEGGEGEAGVMSLDEMDCAGLGETAGEGISEVDVF